MKTDNRPGHNVHRDPMDITKNMKVLGKKTYRNMEERNNIDVEWVREISLLCFLYRQKDQRDAIKSAVRETGIWPIWVNKKSANITSNLAPVHFTKGIPELVALGEEHPTRLSAIKGAADFIGQLSGIDDEAELLTVFERYPTMASYSKAREEAGLKPKRQPKTGTKSKEEKAIENAAKMLRLLDLDPEDMIALEAKEAELLDLARRYKMPSC